MTVIQRNEKINFENYYISIRIYNVSEYVHIFANRGYAMSFFVQRQHGEDSLNE